MANYLDRNGFDAIGWRIDARVAPELTLDAKINVTVLV
jgi:hypothetical protein